MPAKSVRIAVEVEGLETDRRKLSQELEGLRGERPEKLISATDTELAAHDDKISHVARDLERAAARLDDATRRLAAARQEEADAAQLALERDAETAAAAAAKRIASGLPELTKIARALVAQVAQAEILVARANAGRPSGRPRILGAEERSRGATTAARKVLAERTVQRWVFVESGNVLSDEAGAQVASRDGANGVLPSVGLDLNGGKPVVRKAFREVVVLPELRSAGVPSLAEQLAVPGLRSWDVDGWVPMRTDDTDAILAVLAKLEADLSCPDARTPQIELIPV